MANITELLLQQQQQQEQQEIQKKQKLAVSVEKVPDSSPRGTDKHQLVSDIINDIIDAVVVYHYYILCVFVCFLILKLLEHQYFDFRTRWRRSDC